MINAEPFHIHNTKDEYFHETQTKTNRKLCGICADAGACAGRSWRGSARNLRLGCPPRGTPLTRRHAVWRQVLHRGRAGGWILRRGRRGRQHQPRLRRRAARARRDHNAGRQADCRRSTVRQHDSKRRQRSPFLNLYARRQILLHHAHPRKIDLGKPL